MAANFGMNETASKITDAVFELMATTNIPDIKVTDVIKLAHVSKSTFYRHFDSVDTVVKSFEDHILENMGAINEVALMARFSDAELDPTPTMIRRMEVLQENRSKILALNGIHGDPVFTHKATIFMHDHFRRRLESIPSNKDTLDLYLSFALAGHHNLIQYWLEERPDLEPRVVATALNRFMYAPFFVDEGKERLFPRPLNLQK